MQTKEGRTVNNKNDQEGILHSLFHRLYNIDLPTGLQRKVIKQYLTALLMAFAVVILAIYNKSPAYLSGLMISMGLVYLGISTTFDFDAGEIIELAVICTSVRTYHMRNTTHVIFRTDEDTPKYFSFIVPGKKVRNELIQNSGYVIYFRKKAPETLLSFSPI